MSATGTTRVLSFYSIERQWQTYAGMREREKEATRTAQLDKTKKAPIRREEKRETREHLESI